MTSTPLLRRSRLRPQGLRHVTVALLFGSVVLVACGEPRVPSAPTSSQSVVFAPPWRSAPSTAGTEDCVDCHPAIVEDWSGTGMARSLQAVEFGELAGLGVVADGDSGFAYRFAEAPDGERHVLGELRANTPDFAVGYEVLFGIGSGDLDRSYAVAHGAGLWFAPLEVLATEHGRKAVLAPGAMIKPGARVSQPITPECLGCHTDVSPPRGYPLNATPSNVVWKPRGISCAACHGRVVAHAEFQEAELSGEDPKGPDPVLRHAELGRFERLSICAACHLQGDARIVLNGRDLGPPAPGGDLLEQRALFVAAQASDDVGFVSQVERLVLSPCFLPAR